MSYVRQKVAKDEEKKRKIEFARKKEALFIAYEQLDKIFGKPLSAFDIAKIVSFDANYGKVVFTVDTFTFKYKYIPPKNFAPSVSLLLVKSNVWYKRWYNTDYSAKRFKELVDKGKI
jgi:hypothetical protein